jgi:hypothetical protein
MALKYDLLIDKGATYIKTFTWYDPAPFPNPLKLTHGAPKDLTGYIGAMQAREDVNAATTLFSLTSASGGIVIVGGVITIRIEASATEAFTFDSAVYDLKLTAPDGTATRLVEGKVKIDPDVTRA